MKLPSFARSRSAGLQLAVATAVVSGFAVYLNGHAVRAWVQSGVSATGYTTVKNVLAGLILTVLFLALRHRGRNPIELRTVGGLVVIALIGGAIPFVLFFEGLSQATSADAAFIHKTLIVWVALLAIPLLGERIGALHLVAIGLLLGGQAAMRGLSDVEGGFGEALILGATILWAAEAIIARRLLRKVPVTMAAAARMTGGGIALLGWSALTGGLGGLGRISSAEWAWVVLAAAVLATYVAGMYGALARLPAVDVMALLVPGAIITALLQTGFSGAVAPSPSGMVLILGGTGVAVYATGRRALQ